MNILVTGSSGFIGSHLVEALLEQGHEVIGMTRGKHHMRWLEEYAMKQIRYRHLVFDLSEHNPLYLLSHLRGVDLVVHLAARPGSSSWDELNDYVQNNIVATGYLLEAMQSSDVPRLIYVSSSSVYGKVANRSEDGPFEPANPYGVTKLAAEKLCMAYANSTTGKHRGSSFPLVTIVRPFSVYGPRQRPDMLHNVVIRRMLRGALIEVHGSGEQERSNTYVLDLVQAITMMIDQPQNTIGETFNIGGSEMVSVNETIEIISDKLGLVPDISHSESRRGDQIQTLAVTETIMKAVGWLPDTTYSAGIARQISWQKAEMGVPA